METSAAFHRCMRQALTKPSACSNMTSNTKIFTRSSQQQLTRTSHRSFTSATSTRLPQETPTQPTPVSQGKKSNNAASSLPPHNLTQSQPQPQRRIDLSPLQEMTSNNTRSPTAKPETLGARARLDALFNEYQPKDPSENRFQRTLQQTSSPSSSFNTFNIASLFDGLKPFDEPPNKPELHAKLPLRLGPTLGRTVTLDPSRGYDVTRGFVALEMKIRANSVKNDMIRQKHHVRRGQLRKLDRIRRWRTAFKAGFAQEIMRVKRMQKQGW